MLIVDSRVDVEQEFDKGHIKGAIPVTLNQVISGQWIPPNEKDKEIIFYCSWPDEKTSARVALELIDKGYTDVKALKGGFNAWKDASYPLETGTPK